MFDTEQSETTEGSAAAEGSEEFSCYVCGSPAVVLPAHLTDDAPVRCRRCRTVLCTLAEFRLSAENGLATDEAN
jgi:hypothetical protein